MSFASISCCRGPTKADIESAWRPDATAERIGSRGIRLRQELTTASMDYGFTLIYLSVQSYLPYLQYLVSTYLSYLYISRKWSEGSAPPFAALRSSVLLVSTLMAVQYFFQLRGGGRRCLRFRYWGCA